MLDFERHRLGTRVYLLGVRLHEWHLGAVILLALVISYAAGLPQLALSSKPPIGRPSTSSWGHGPAAGHASYQLPPRRPFVCEANEARAEALRIGG
jgi:hypothetical protein